MGKESNQTDFLRAEAEAQIIRSPPTAALPDPVKGILHELQVHQIELEMQNEELRHAQVALEESRDRYADLYEFAPVAYLTLTRTGQIAESNLAGASLLGVDRNKLLQHHFNLFVSPKDRDRWHLLFVGVMGCAEKRGIDLVLQRGDGSEIHAHLDCLRAQAIDSAPVVRMTLTDISAMQLNHQLREAQDDQRKLLHEAMTLLRRNQALLQNSLEGIHIMDIEGNVVEVNDAFCNMLGYTHAEALLLNVADWDASYSREQLRERFESLIGDHAQFEVVHRRKDGKLLHVEITSCGIELDGTALIYAVSRDITQRKQAEAALLKSEANLRAMLDNSPYLAWLKDTEGRYIAINKVFAEFLRLEDARQAIGKTDLDLQPKELAEKYRADDVEVMKNRRQKHVEESAFDGNKVSWVETYKTPIIDEHGNVLGTVGFASDITERKNVEEALRVAAVTFETHDAILITDAKANIIRVNQAFTDITGYTQEEVLGQNPRIMSSGRQDRAFYIEMWQQLLHTNSWAGEIWDKRKNGQIYPKWLTITAVKNKHQQTTNYVAIFSDISARKQNEEEIRNLAFYDMLTRLPNRRLFMDRFRAALTISMRRNDYGAVLFIDMDRFKALNDTFGHDHGDMLLIEVAARIKSCVREMDTVARLGGDEFVVLIEGISEDQDEASRKVGIIAEKIRETLAHPYCLNSHEHHSSPSIGISLYRGNEAPVDVLIQQADMAMYQAKAAGRNAVRFFDPVMQHNVATRAALESDLHHAVALGQMHLHYQIQVDHQQRPSGAEALLRWFHPECGLIMPDHFMPIAEESALIFEIGDWLLEQAAAQLAAWAEDECMRAMTLAVNISARQFAHPNFVDRVAGVMGRHRIVPSLLKLELTERLVLDDLENTIATMRALKRLGVKLVMDDFGTGYSSFSYLRYLPLDQIKIDREFVQGITRVGNDSLLVRAIMDMAANFCMSVIAEGVETEAQLEFLKHHDCTSYQGFLFSKPLPIGEFEKLVGSMSWYV